MAVLLMLGACAGDPEKASREGALAQQQLDSGQLKLAQRTVLEAISERDDLPALHLLRGRIEFAAGNVSAAYQAYEDALGLDPANVEALQGVAHLGLRVGNLSQSEQAADRILALQPDQIDALLIKGVHQLIRNKTADALATAERALVLDPTNEGGTILKARSQFFTGEAATALATVRAREKVLGRTESLALTELELLREARDSKGMLEVFAFLHTAHGADLRIDEANLRYKLQDINGARTLLRDALLGQHLSPDQLAAIIGLWREYDDKPLTPVVVDRVTNAPPSARYEIARYFLSVANPSAAKTVMRGLSSSEAQGIFSRIALAEGKADAATRLANATLIDDETQCDSLIARATASIAGNRVEPAISDGQRAVAECPLDPTAALTLVAAYERRSNSLGVQRSFADAVLRMPQDSELSRAFWTWLEAQQRPREAVAEARRLTRKAPALISGWRSYLDVCSAIAEMNCAAEARVGLDRAQTTFGIDLPPGKSLPKGLSGRLGKP